jgi:protein-export membrane protein SecD/preprotein translocase SecF subunit
MRLIYILLLAGLGLYLISPSIIYFSLPKESRNDADVFERAVPDILPREHVKLGLDLQGGVQLVLGVNTLEAVASKIGTMSVEVSRWASDNKIPVASAYAVKDSQILRIQLTEGADEADFKDRFKQAFAGFEWQGRDGNKLDYTYSDEEIRNIRRSAVEQAERVIRSRVDKWGVAEPQINRRADNSILVQLPGFKDPQKAKSLLGRTAQLKFKLVDSDFRGFDALTAQLPSGVEYVKIGEQTSFTADNPEAIRTLTQGKIPENRELLFERQAIAGNKNKARYQSYVVEANTELTGEDVVTASVGQGAGFDPTPVVSIQLTAAGGRRFSDLTTKHIGGYLAIVLDDEVVSAPVIQTKILDGRAQISMNSGRDYNLIIEEANELALILRSGSLPAKINVLEERQVGATLGPELANEGLLGVAVGFVLVVLIMLGAYRKPGAIACVALALGAIWLFALMGSFGFALTLPGIAGFVLTMGMAVDANILINERIRFEARSGKNAKKAVEIGFQRTTWTILDANITTLIAALVLLETNSSGPIRGFAITLILGIFVTLFISLYVSRVFFEWVISRSKSEQQIRGWLGGSALDQVKNYSYNFVGSGRVITIFSVVIAVLVLGLTGARGLNWGVDFAGGTEIQVAFKTPLDPARLRQVVEDSGINDASVQALGTEGLQYLMRFDREAIKEKTQSDLAGSVQEEALNAQNSEKVQLLQQNILSVLADSGPEILQADFVGPQVGKALRMEGMYSVILSILFIFVYIAIRFDTRFSPGVAVKMILDVLLLLGFYAFFWRSFDLTSVAAFLTVIGYSVNDTVVIYDRIRENLATNARRSLRENINISVNETLTRTFYTSVTTIVSLVGIIVFAQGPIRDFALAMALGVLIATLSSMFIASSFILWSERWLKSFRGRKRVSAKSAS